MIRIFIFDYHNAVRNGIKTYIHNLIEGFENHKQIRITQVILNSNFKDGIVIQEINSITKYHVPFDIGQGIHVNDNLLIEFVKDNLIKGEKNIFHFNWINHGVFAHLLKRLFSTPRRYLHSILGYTGHNVRTKQQIANALGGT
ncbi:hypothetical protein [Sphingobacterium lumbrici]|uniref:hypothetical protein n=1 Tax=Sphingobacterium lumbrici TaxID=2559600 RepID=UPI00112A1594|nr:hypothetical protein [Sphingobacterium lumbrici]